MKFGVNWESFDPISPALCSSLAAMGCKLVRLFVFWPDTNPQPGIFVWDRIDKEVAAIKGAGMEVYLNPYWAPAHASEGQPTYETYTNGCTRFDKSGSVYFAKELPYCAKPAHIDPDASFAFGEALARRYKDKMDYVGIWNEPGQSLYYPPNTQGGDWGRQFVDEIVAPFTEGILAKWLQATTVGPEADMPSIMDGILRDASPAKGTYDYVSCHPYAWDPAKGFPQDTFDRLKEFQDAAGNYGFDATDVWITELGPSGKPELIPAFVKRLTDEAIVPVCLFHDSDLFIEKGKPNGLYKEMQKILL